MMGVREIGGPRQGGNIATRTCVGNAITTALQNCHHLSLGLGLGRHLDVWSPRKSKEGWGR